VRTIRHALIVGCLLARAALGAGYHDAHLHVNDIDAALAMMRAHGISRAAVFWGRDTDNADIVRAAAEHPQLVPLLCVSPERSATYGAWWRAGDRRLLAYAERELARGVYRGLGELSIVHFPGRGFPETEFSPLHPLMVGLMELAARHRLPVLVHCEITYARELSELLARYPRVPFLWAHGGYAPYYWTERMLARHRNLTIELSMRMVRDHPRSPDYTILMDEKRVWPRWLEMIERMPDRFVVGSDASQRDAETDAARARSVFALLDQLTPAVREKVARTNFDALFGVTSAARPASLPAARPAASGLRSRAPGSPAAPGRRARR
jgi:predicted TIM-barrel fold metal-dependent hydrolase